MKKMTGWRDIGGGLYHVSQIAALTPQEVLEDFKRNHKHSPQEYSNDYYIQGLGRTPCRAPMLGDIAKTLSAEQERIRERGAETLEEMECRLGVG